MKRTRRTRTAITAPTKKASAILVSDIHLTDSTPVARTDDYIRAQERKLEFIHNLSIAHGGCPIIHGGDLFHHWKASPWLLAWAYKHLPTPMVTIAGNHDLPQHSIDQYDKSALHLLDTTMDKLTVLKENPAEHWIEGRQVLILHQLVWPESYRSLRDIAGGWTAQEVLEEYPNYDLILTGDNHLPFVEEREGRLLVNPGSTMRSTADQMDHRPRCYLYYAEDNTVEAKYLPIAKDVLSREHIDKKNERDNRIAAYIEKMGMSWEAGLSFRQNLEAFFQENNTPRKVVELIWEHIEM